MYKRQALSLFALETLEGACQVLAYGREKYAAWNWAKGANHSVPFDSMMRHLIAWQNGEEIDPESGLGHLDHAMCNMMFLIYYSLHYPELDDRFVRPQEDMRTVVEELSLPMEIVASRPTGYMHVGEKSPCAEN